MIILDTHILVWWIQNDPQLTPYHRECIEQERSNGLGVCTISLIEIARLVSAGRIILPIPIAQWFESALAQEGVTLISMFKLFHQRPRHLLLAQATQLGFPKI